MWLEVCGTKECHVFAVQVDDDDDDVPAAAVTKAYACIAIACIVCA